MNTLHKCEMSFFCLNRNPDSDLETDYCNITECPYMILKRKYYELIQNRKDLEEFIKECDNDIG